MAAFMPFQTAYLEAQPFTKSNSKYRAKKKAMLCPKQADTHTMGIPAKP